MTPPTPVLAPPNGSTADGWLWVSALRASVVPGTNDTTPALPTNAERTNGASTVSVAARRRSSSAGRAWPSLVVMAARKVLWAQCSLHVWASVSSSTSVGSRPCRRKCVWTAASSAGSRARARCVLSSTRRSGSRSRSGIVSTQGGSARARMEVGLGDARRPLLDDGVGDEPTQQSLGGLGVGVRGELEAPSGGGRDHRNAELVRSLDDGVGRGVGDAGMECDLDARVGPVRSHVPVCSSGSARIPSSRRRSPSDSSPSTNTTSATPTGPSSVSPSVAAPAATALARGSVSRERTVNRCIGPGPDPAALTDPTLGTVVRRHEASERNVRATTALSRR